VNVPLAKEALPAAPTDPISPSVHRAKAATVSPTVVEFVRLPDVPVIVTVAGPGVAPLLAISVNVLEPVVGFGLNDAVTPLGSPDADSVTPLPKPFSGVTVIVLMPVPP
jgi:hypothetical protein